MIKKQYRASLVSSVKFLYRSDSSTTTSASGAASTTTSSDQTTDSSSGNGGSSSGLSAGGEAAIAISAVAFVGLGVGAAVFLHRRRKLRNGSNLSYSSVPGNVEGSLGGSNGAWQPVE